jgi:ADP-ribosylglycohydrolase
LIQARQQLKCSRWSTQGASFEEASKKVHQDLDEMTAGCNPSHRIAPVAMCASIGDDAMEETAVSEATLTHRHPLSGEVAAVVTRLCRELIRGMAWHDVLVEVSKGRTPNVYSALVRPNVTELSDGGFAPGVLRTAIHFLDTSYSFSSALSKSIGFAGHANYCPVLVGSIGGARWGTKHIDEGLYIHHGGLVPRLLDAAFTLGAEWGSGMSP